MGLNKGTGNMYEFVTHTWNTIKGECPHGCTYCYMKRWGKQNPVRFDEKELKTDLGQGNFIFVGSSCDMFADDIWTRWIHATLDHCKNFDNKYLFQSKNPARIKRNEYLLPEKSVICTTIETNRFYKEIMNYSPDPYFRGSAMRKLPGKKYVTIEPIMDFDLEPFVYMIKSCQPLQVNIGADSGNNNLPEPTAGQIDALIGELIKAGIKFHLKQNLNRLYKRR